jgi:aromatic amino acid transport protein AroP
MGGILLIMSSTPEMRIAVVMIPVWIGLLMIAYFFKRKKENQTVVLDTTKISSLPEA